MAGTLPRHLVASPGGDLLARQSADVDARTGLGLVLLVAPTLQGCPRVADDLVVLDDPLAVRVRVVRGWRPLPTAVAHEGVVTTASHREQEVGLPELLPPQPEEANRGDLPVEGFPQRFEERRCARFFERRCEKSTESTCAFSAIWLLTIVMATTSLFASPSLVSSRRLTCS